MYKRRDSVEVLYEIKNQMPEFNKEDFLDYAKWTIVSIFNSLKKDSKSEIKGNYDPKLIEKLVLNKDKYRIKKDIDDISVQYLELMDFIKEGNKKSIKLYASIYFYDNSKNNYNCPQDNEKYWNDIWIITFDLDENTINSINNKCPNCGANMLYDKQKEIYKCKYCNNIINSNNNSYWKISNIEIGQ